MWKHAAAVFTAAIVAGYITLPAASTDTPAPPAVAAAKAGPGVSEASRCVSYGWPYRTCSDEATATTVRMVTTDRLR